MTQQRFRQLTLPLSLFLMSCTGFPYAGVIEESRRFMVEEHPEAFFKTQGDESISYVKKGNPDGTVVLFVHGSPGNWAANAHFFKNKRLTQNFELVAFDRFGYGANRQGEPHGELAEQIQAPLAILKDLNIGERKLIVVGHSYGGPVALKLAAHRPDLVDGLVLVAAAVDPELEEMKWYQYVVASWGLRSVVPDDLDVCNREILDLKAELIVMEEEYPKIQMPVEVIQGTLDRLVPKENVDYLKKNLQAESVNFTVQKGMRHYVPWAFPSLIEEAIFRL